MSAEKEEVIIEVIANYTYALVVIGKYQQETEKLRAEQVRYKEELKGVTSKKEACRFKINETNTAIKTVCNRSKIQY